MTLTDPMTHSHYQIHLRNFKTRVIRRCLGSYLDHLLMDRDMRVRLEVGAIVLPPLRLRNPIPIGIRRVGDARGGGLVRANPKGSAAAAAAAVVPRPSRAEPRPPPPIAGVAIAVPRAP